MHARIVELRSRYDVIIIVVMRLLAMPRAQIVSLPVGGFVVVADTTNAGIPQLSCTLADLRRAGTTTVGLALDRGKRQNDRVDYYRVGPSADRACRGKFERVTRRAEVQDAKALASSGPPNRTSDRASNKMAWMPSPSSTSLPLAVVHEVPLPVEESQPSPSAPLESSRVSLSPDDERSDALSGASQVGIDPRSRHDRG